MSCLYYWDLSSFALPVIRCPGSVVFGGGLSKGFKVYEKAMIQSISENSPIFKRNPCVLEESVFKSKSHMVGAAINLKRKWKI